MLSLLSWGQTSIRRKFWTDFLLFTLLIPQWHLKEASRCPHHLLYLRVSGLRFPLLWPGNETWSAVPWPSWDVVRQDWATAQSFSRAVCSLGSRQSFSSKVCGCILLYYFLFLQFISLSWIPPLAWPPTPPHTILWPGWKKHMSFTLGHSDWQAVCSDVQCS